MARLILPAMPAVPTQPSIGNLQDWAASVKNWADTVRGKIEVWSSQAATYTQIHGVQGGSLEAGSPSGVTSGTTYTLFSGSFVAPVAGLFVGCMLGNNDTDTMTGSWEGNLIVDSTTVAADTLGSPSWGFAGTLAVAAGSHTITTTVKPTSTISAGVYSRGFWLFVPTP